MRAVVLDHYGDADTRAAAAAVAAIPDTGQGFDDAALLTAAARLAPAWDYPLVCGSGLDGQPEVLARLGRERVMLGNPPSIQCQFRDPRHFFEWLDRCRIPYPEVRFQRPRDPAGWLIKSGCSEGGKRVRFCAHHEAAPGDYFQHHIEGAAHSALFLANGESARLLGINTLWTLDRGETPFLFAGAMSHPLPQHPLTGTLSGWLDRLARATGLVGLGSLDFVLDRRGQPQVLEVNARPSATLALHDPDYAEGLLAAHVRACRSGQLVDIAPARQIRAFRVALAPRTMTLPADIRWPAWVADRPMPGTRCEAGQPLCTVLAAAPNPAATLAQLARRHHRLNALLPP